MSAFLLKYKGQALNRHRSGTGVPLDGGVLLRRLRNYALLFPIFPCTNCFVAEILLSNVDSLLEAT